MKSKNEIINEIKSIGLFEDHRGNIYGEEYVPFLRRGHGFWQYPEELADLVVFLRNLKISTFLNVGTFNGLTFNFVADNLEGPLSRCVTIDPNDHNPESRAGREYLKATSADFRGESFDLVFIDGDHSYSGVVSDWESVGVHAGVVVFHDIVDEFVRELDGGVPRLWEELKNSSEGFKRVEFVRGNDPGFRSIMGIGVLYRPEALRASAGREED